MPATQPDEQSLEEITARALQSEHTASDSTARRGMPQNPQPSPSRRQNNWSASVSRYTPSHEALDSEALNSNVPESDPEPHVEEEPSSAVNGYAGLEHSIVNERAASAPVEEAAPEAETAAPSLTEPAPAASPEPLPASPFPEAAAKSATSDTPATSEVATATPDSAAKSAPLKITPLQQGQKAAQRVAGFARSKAAPMVANGVLWLAHNLRRRELRKRYGEALVFTHNRVLDRRLERLFFVPTLKAAVTNPAPQRGILYDGPVPSVVFNWALSALPEDLREYTFIDFHAGRGRTMLLAAAREFERIVGFEYDDELFDDLQMNIAQFPRSEMTCRNIDCFRGDIDGIRIPDQPSVMYFSSSWREKMFANIMEHVRQTYQQSPRRMYIILENADNAVMMPKDGVFFKIEPPAAVRAKLKLLSPMDFQIYRTSV